MKHIGYYCFTGDSLVTVTANDADYTNTNNVVTYSLLPAGKLLDEKYSAKTFTHRILHLSSQIVQALFLILLQSFAWKNSSSEVCSIKGLVQSKDRKY